MKSPAWLTVVLAIITGLTSVLVSRSQRETERVQQDKRNVQGSVGYETLADRVNTIELQQELIIRACVQRQPQQIKPLTLQGLTLTPLKRVPSRLEHLPTELPPNQNVTHPDASAR